MSRLSCRRCGDCSRVILSPKKTCSPLWSMASGESPLSNASSSDKSNGSGRVSVKARCRRLVLLPSFLLWRAISRSKATALRS